MKIYYCDTKSKAFKMMMNDAFREYERKRHKKDILEKLLILKLIRYTGVIKDECIYDIYVETEFNKINPFLYIGFLICLLYSIFDGGIISYIKNFPKEYNDKNYITVGKSTYSKYINE